MCQKGEIQASPIATKTPLPSTLTCIPSNTHFRVKTISITIGKFQAELFMFSPRNLPMFFLLLGITVRVVRWALAFPLWGDEAFIAVNLLDRDYLSLLQPLRHYQIAPLGFLWSEKFSFNLLGTSELALRALPCLAGCASLWFFWKACCRMFSWKVGLWALSILAVSYYPIRHACEIKPYANDLLASSVLLWIFSIHFQNKESTTAWVLLATLAPVLLFLSFPAVFIALGVWAGMIACDAKSWSVKKLSLRGAALLLICLAFLGHLRLVADQQFHNEQQKHQAYWDSTFPPANPIRFLPWFLETHAGNMSAYPMGGKNWASSIQAMLCMLGIMVLAKRKQWALMVALLAPFFLNLVAAAMGRYPYGGSARVAQHLAPAICMMIALGLATCLKFIPKPKVKSTLLRSAFVVLSGIGFLFLGRDVLHPYKSEEDTLVRSMIRSSLLDTTLEKPLVITRPKEQLDPGIEWYLRTTQGYLKWMTFDEFQTKGKVLPLRWLWLAGKDEQGEYLNDIPPDMLNGINLEHLKGYYFPLGRDRTERLQAELIQTLPGNP